MNTLEKNDVDISKLFAWGNGYDLIVNGKSYKVWIRLVGDAELNRARVFAFRKSAELRSKLKNEDSDEYWAMIPREETLDGDDLVNMSLLAYTRYFTDDAIKDVDVPVPIEPDEDSSLEYKEEYQKKIDEYPTLRQNMIREFINKKIEEKRKELESMDKGKLYRIYTKILVDQLCENEMVNKFREMCTYLGLYKEKTFKTKLFETYDDFTNIPTGIKNQLMDFYQSLEINSEELKK